MIDIIIPAHDCKDTIERTLSSLVAQTSKKFIVTIVDDCSTQDILPIIKQYNKKLKMKYIRLNENLKYPGLVRQVGIDATNAPFIMFLDSDDILAPQAIEVANNEILKTNSDVVIGYFYRQQENGIYTLLKENCSTWLHGNVYKRSFLVKNNIKFSKGYNEDGAFNTQCYLLADRCCVLPMPIYYWMNNEESLTRKITDFTLKNAGDVVSTLQFAYNNILNNKKLEEKEEKVFKNLGAHFFMFFNLENNFLKNTDSCYTDSYDNFKHCLTDFVFSLKITERTEQQIGYFKEGFIKNFIKKNKNDNIITVKEFFKECVLSFIDFNVEDFSFLEDKNESSSN